MGLEAHPSFVELQEVREKRKRKLTNAFESFLSFGSTLGSMSSLESRALTRSGSKLRSLGSFASVDRPRLSSGSNSTGKKVCRLDSCVADDKRNYSWSSYSERTSSSLESNSTQKYRDDYKASLAIPKGFHVTEPPLRESGTYRVKNSGNMPAKSATNEIARNQLMPSFERYKEAALEENISGNKLDFPRIPDSI